MSDQKIAEFRARAELGVTEVDPDLLLRRGTAMRRRRQLVPVGVVAACAAIGIGIFSSLGGDPSTGQDPTSERTEVQYLDDPKYLDGLEAGEYALHPVQSTQFEPQLSSGGSPPFATVELDGGWYGGSNAAYRSDAGGTVSWGLDLAFGIDVDRCHPDGSQLPPGLTRAQVVDRVATSIGTQVISPPVPATALRLRGTYLQVSIPIILECPTGTVEGYALLATWDGPSPAPRVTVDVWVLGRGQDMVMLTRSVRGEPSPETIASLDAALGTLELGPTG
jgi:hypothetical protein